MATASKAAPAKKKKSNKLLYSAIGFVVFSLIMYVGMMRPQGSIKFGICQVFIEKTLSYPLEFRVVSEYEKPDEVRMEYTTINEYGEYILSQVACSFRPDPVTTWALTEVQLKRVKLPQEMIDAFNPTIPAILLNPPDLTLPLPPSVDLMGLQR